MSAETKAAIEDAIRAHVADESAGDLLTGWFLVGSTALADDGGAMGYWYQASDQAIHVSLGLAEMGRWHLRRCLDEDEDD